MAGGDIPRRGLFSMALFASFAGLLRRTRATEQRFPDIAEFREIVIAAIKRLPGVESAVADPSDPAKINTRIGNEDVTSDVTNIFGYLNSYPDENAEAAIDRFVRVLTAAHLTKVGENNLIAVVRTLQYADQLKSPGTELLYEPLVGELAIVYMADLHDSISPISSKDFPGRALSDLRDVALNNVKKWLPKIVSDGDVGIAYLYYVEGNTMLSTSLILLDEFWMSIKPHFPGDVLFALPRRDQLFVFDASNPNAQNAARQMIDVTFKDGFNLLSDKIFERRNGKLLAQA
ncbi:hypothetical protein DPM33_03930 [Mesorhizobium hawassense]|uniref:DUF1444 family protein n=1 Tax=Mesorhizobium hawassense TaxID=1209954 RepID=A0A330I7L6_9HYPH|nr:DUF1444 family protein [Mesorhizobium hawassense]RAZ93007.1 hypothetical protein DPM33_03930 [Mesorhizobium hawassense]